MTTRMNSNPMPKSQRLGIALLIQSLPRLTNLSLIHI